MREIEYKSREGMEKSVAEFVRRLNEENVGSISAMLAPELISCDYEKMEIIVRYPVREWMRNPGGVMHGGAVAAAMDTTMGSNTFYWANEKVTPTINMLTNFQRPVPLGAYLYVRSKVTCAGRTMIYATSEAWSEANPEKILVTATGVYHIPRG